MFKLKDMKEIQAYMPLKLCHILHGLTGARQGGSRKTTQDVKHHTIFMQTKPDVCAYSNMLD